MEENRWRHCNVHMASRQFCEPDAAGHRFLEVVTETLGFSVRAHTRILKVARTIADPEGAESIREHHIAEAVQYRSLDRKQF
ncbi:hypothetical protein GURASL_05420 [Geotalea uraniireducens]|uniref:Mg chelatase-related protein C-terminal domain-containing protein n=1 Tax=Geotalea uraniireducens TaxID=351604 RepID=A0ABN6VN27_9BACT|nr:hypothetical protein [Geotalea uraniireducens]BDV41619.1 hypothetical protein GURASL_05420 [Geotalea uraniireducens]